VDIGDIGDFTFDGALLVTDNTVKPSYTESEFVKGSLNQFFQPVPADMLVSGLT